MSSPENGTESTGRPGAWMLLWRNRLATLGLGIVALICLVALGAPVLPLADPNATHLDQRLLPPFSEGHLFGTDHLGRDLLSRIIWGSRVSIAVGVVAASFAAAIGSAIGLIAGFYPRWIDTVLMRGIDILMAFPYMLLALTIVAALGPGLLNALFAVAIVNIPFFARTVRGVTVGLVGREYVDAARLSGFSDARILLVEILPNVMPVIVITISTTVGWMILETAGLSFLGLGAQPPQADLGSMLGDGRKLIVNAPYVATIPGLVILVLVIGINLLGDGLRDILDPRLRAGGLTRPGPATAVESRIEEGEEIPGPGGKEPILNVEKLRTWFFVGDSVAKAADDVSFELKPGEALGIVGESGSGKSVTALSILGLVPTPPGRIVGGRVLYQGDNLVGMRVNALQRIRGNRIAYIFQDPQASLNPLFRVGEQIAEALQRHQGISRTEARQRAVELMDLAEIPKAEDRLSAYPHELSGGLQQRVVIAMALANDPEILIADEPTTDLDVTTQAEILRLLHRLRRERGLSLLFITHDFGVIYEICDRVLVLYAGQVAETGTVDEVFFDPRHPYTRRLLACVPRLGEHDRELDAIPGLPPPVDDLPFGCYFADRCDVVLDACRQQDIKLDRLGPGRTARCIRAREKFT